MTYEPELGQAIFSNSPWYETTLTPLVESGLSFLGELVANGEWDKNPTVNTGAEFANDVFVMRAYCWCDGGAPGHEEGCPPNFEFCDFSVRWYKHVGRGATQSREMPPSEWMVVVRACLDSLGVSS